MESPAHLWPTSDSAATVFVIYSVASLTLYVGITHFIEWIIKALDFLWSGTKEKIEGRIETGTRISNIVVMSFIFGVGYYLFLVERRSVVAISSAHKSISSDLASTKTEVSGLKDEREQLLKQLLREKDAFAKVTRESDQLAAELASERSAALVLKREKDELLTERSELREKNKQLEAWQEIRQNLLPIAALFPQIRIRIVNNYETVRFARQLAAVFRSIGINVPGDYPFYNTGMGRGIFVIVRDQSKPTEKAQVLQQALKRVFDRVYFLSVANADDAAPELAIGQPPQ